MSKVPRSVPQGKGRQARGALTKVAVTGAAGRMGREVLQAVAGAPDLALVGAVSRAFAGVGRPHASALESELAGQGVATFADLGPCLDKTRPDVVVDFTTATAAPGIIRAALEAGVSPVSGTTGLAPGEVEDLGKLAEAKGLGAVIIPNFSLGATVLAILARTAAPYFAAAEIVELHHDQKRDAPSGTALALARTVAAGLRRPAAAEAAPAAESRRAGVPSVASAGPGATPGDQPSRGLMVNGVPVHSVRLSGLVAHHELIFASSGETVTLRHDSMSRASFMPGVLLAVRSVGRFTGLVTSLERLIELARPDAGGI